MRFMTPSLIFEDEHILVINKPSAVVVHPFDFSTEETLLDFLKEYIPETFIGTNTITLQDKRVIDLGGIVHKLDRDTSGVLVVAKDERVRLALQDLFQNHTIEKTYQALVEGLVEKDSFTIDAPLGRNKKDYKQVAYPKNPRGELLSAETSLQVLKRNDDTTFVELKPRTGRTHQLRAHMAHIGHPIVGDKAYGSTQNSPHIMLHAKHLSFALEGKEYSFEAESGWKLGTV